MTTRTAAALLAAAASSVPAPALADREGPIQDNSFLVEEAYNQEPGVIQHISSFSRALGGGGWLYSFTEEWPVLGQTHQASVTVSYAGLRSPAASGIGDLALNYRWQAVGSGEARLALAPRFTALLPTGDAGRGLGAGGAGAQVSFPASAVLSEHLVAHLNLGGTWVPSARTSSGGRGTLTAYAAGQSLVWLAHRSFNVLAELLYTRTAVAAPAGAERAEALTFSPGVRAAADLAGGLQVVPGVGFPIGLGPSRGERAVLLYLSFEHPCRLAGAAP